MRTYWRLTGPQQELELRREHQSCKENRAPDCVPGQRPRRASQAKLNLESRANRGVRAREWGSSAMSQGWLRMTKGGGGRAGKHFKNPMAQL